MPATPARAHSCRAAGAVGKGLEARLCGLRPAPLAAARKGDHRSFRGPSLAAAAAPGPRPRRSPSPPRVASLELPRADAPEAPAAPSASATPGPLRSSRVPPPRDALILATGTDHAHTAGYAHSQHELAQVLAAAIRSGSILCCPRTVAPTVEEQAAKALRMFEAVGVQTRGSRHAPVRGGAAKPMHLCLPAPLPRSASSSTSATVSAARPAPAWSACWCRAWWPRHSLL